MDSAPGQLEFGGEPGENCVFCVVSPEFGTAYQAFSDLSGWVNEDYAQRIPLINDRWRELEQHSFDIQDSFEKYILGQWKSQPSLSEIILGRYCRGIVVHSVYQARLLMSEEKTDMDFPGNR